MLDAGDDVGTEDVRIVTGVDVLAVALSFLLKRRENDIF
jgi:hypothetical protein